MVDNNTSHNLSGSWRGHYSYSSHSGSYDFEAVFIEKNGVVDGNILDDGRLGEGSVHGTWVAKRYTGSKELAVEKLDSQKLEHEQKQK